MVGMKLYIAFFCFIHFNKAIEYDCPEGWFTFDVSCYKFVSSPLKAVEQAKTECAEDGAGLLEIASTEEHNFVKARLIALTGSLSNKPGFYTAGHRNTSTGVYQWAGDRAIESDEFWLRVEIKTEGQPLGLSKILYIYNATQGKWGWTLNDGRVPQSYICEIAKSDVFKIKVELRKFDFGVANPESDPELWARGPKFIKQPKDVIFFSSSSFRFISFDCVASGHPAVSYYWNRTRQDQVITIDTLKPENKNYTITNGKLTIKEPTRAADYGIYQCIAYNKYGSVVSQKAELSFGYISDFPRVTRAEVKSTSYSGAVIDCNPPAASPSNLLYQWYKDSPTNFVITNLKPYIFISNSGKLLFSYVTKQDEGYYTCIVGHAGQPNNDNKISKPIKLSVATGVGGIKEPSILNDFPSLFPKGAVRGADARLECFAWGTNDLDYKWTKDGASLPRLSSVAEQGRVLNIPNIQIEDAGTYRCHVTRKQGLTASKPIQVTLAAAPYFSNFGNQFVDQLVDEGATVQWKCDALGTKQLEYKWTRNAKKLSPASLSAADQARYTWNTVNNVLTITGVTKKDEGMYQCAASNLYGVQYVTGQLKTYAFSPLFSKNPLSDRYGVVDGNLTILCKPEASPRAEVEWWKDGAKLTTSTNTNARLQLVGRTNLFIKKVERGDMGNYTCRATNKHGSTSSSAFLTILDKPQLQQLPLDEDIGFNRTQMIRCRGNPGPVLDVIYIWKHNTRVIRLEGHPEINPPDPNYERGTGIRDGYLIIKNTTFATGGHYSCVFTTPVSELSWPLSVKIYGPPGPPAGLKAVLKPGVADQMILTWFKGGENNRPITNYRVEATNNHNPGVWEVVGQAPAQTALRMEVKNLNPWTSYKFRVLAQNIVGWGEPSDISSEVTTPTKKPNVYPINIGGGGGKVGTLVITWNRVPPVKQYGPKIGYIVSWRRKGGSETDWVPTTINSNSSEYVKTLGSQDINIYKEFDVKVQAFNELFQGRRGLGPESPFETIYSAEGLPIARPTQLRIEPFNMTAIRVYWTPVSDDVKTMKGVLAGYRISYQIRGQPDYTQLRKTYFGQRRSGIITGLRPLTTYRIKVQVFNTAGNGDFSEYQDQETLRPSPRNMPEDVRVYAATDTMIKLTWRGVSTTPNEEPLAGYKIRFWKASESIHKNIIIDVQRATYATITGLEPDTAYNFRVMGYSRGGNGKMSSPMIQVFMIKDACQRGYRANQEGSKVTVRCASCCHIVSYVLITLVTLFHITRNVL